MRAEFIVIILLGTGSLFGGSVEFDGVKPGGLPAGWLGGTTGQGQAKWAVVEDASAPSPGHHALKQSGAAKFCWCVQTNVSIQNGSIAVKFKPLSGKEDQAGGLIWRWQDGNNYYVTRANALEDNVTIYAGATILGNVTIGHDSIIGGNVWLLEAVKPNTVVYQEGGKTIMHSAAADRGRMLGQSHGADI